MKAFLIRELINVGKYAFRKILYSAADELIRTGFENLPKKNRRRNGRVRAK